MPSTCPRCRRTSHHPEDARQGWCASCRAFTYSGSGTAVPTHECLACGQQAVMPEYHAGALWCPCGSPDPMAPVMRHLQASSLSAGMWQVVAGSPGLSGRIEFDPAAAARYIAERYGGPAEMVLQRSLDGLTMEVRGFDVDPNMVSMLITGRSQNGALIGTDSGERQDEVDDCPWDDAATWSPGYTEPD